MYNLESKGWTITRIWSRNWWQDKNAEIERIDQLIKRMIKEEEVKGGLSLAVD